VMMQRNTSRIV